MDTEQGPLPDDMARTIEEICTSFGGWCTPEKGRMMAALVLRERPAVVVEVGVYRGRSFLPQALAVRRNGCGFLYAVDPWEAAPTQRGGNTLPESERWWASNDFVADYRFFRDALWKFGVEDLVEVLRATSDEAAASFGPAPEIDILHIDGNHSTDCALEDVRLWVPRVRPGGYVWLDDTDWDTVRDALPEMDRYCSLVKHYDRYSLYHKRPTNG